MVVVTVPHQLDIYHFLLVLNVCSRERDDDVYFPQRIYLRRYSGAINYSLFIKLTFLATVFHFKLCMLAWKSTQKLWLIQYSMDGHARPEKKTFFNDIFEDRLYFRVQQTLATRWARFVQSEALYLYTDPPNIVSEIGFKKVIDDLSFKKPSLITMEYDVRAISSTQPTNQSPKYMFDMPRSSKMDPGRSLMKGRSSEVDSWNF